jgi:hypothetical protein
MAAANRISLWGIASLVLMVGGIGFGEYNLYLYDHTGTPRIPWTVYNKICVIVQLAAVIFGLIAVRRGSVWWALPVAPALYAALVCFFGET